MAPGNALTSPISAFTIGVTPETRPAVFTLPDFPSPLFWSGQRGYRHETLRMLYANFMSEEITIQSGFSFQMNRRQRPQMEVRTFLKSASLDLTLQEFHDMRGLHLMLAKIAYCFAAAIVGIEAFDGAPIRALLAGERMDMATFVGGYHGGESLPQDSLHILHLRERLGVLYVIVHLFASRGARPFEVVVGTKA